MTGDQNSAELMFRPLEASAVPQEGVTVEIVADAAERAALAEANETVSVESLKATVEVRPSGRAGLKARGTLYAQATRICVVTLESFVETVDEEIDVRFEPEGSFDPEDENAPDPIIDGEIDLGALAAEFFTLGLDPYPRKPGAVLDLPDDASDAASPFVALRGLAQRPGDKE